MTDEAIAALESVCEKQMSQDNGPAKKKMHTLFLPSFPHN